MSRVALLLATLGAVLVLVLFYIFVWSPKSAEIDEIEAQIEATQLEQVQLQQRITRLQDVRRRAPEIEAALVAAQSIIPADPALPVALRQLQLAADDSGATLRSITVGEPDALEAIPGAAELTLNIVLEGGYYQIVDFLRRVQDPTIIPRAIQFEAMSVSPLEYPVLNAVLTGAMYTTLPAPAVPPPAPPAEGAVPPAPTDGATQPEEVQP